MDIGNIGSGMFCWRLFLPVVLLLAMLVPGCGLGEEGDSCPGGLTAHKGKCLTTMAIVYFDCTEGRGISTSTKLSGGVGASLKLVTNASANAALEKTKQDDRAVALQVIKDCLELAKQSRPGDAEQPAVTRLIETWKPKKELPRNHIIPDVAGLTSEEARKVLDPYPFNLEDVDEASADVEEGKVIRTDPAAEQEAAEGSTVKLFISSGPEPAVACVVPSVTDLQLDDAAQLLANAGCNYQINQVETPDVEPGTVLGQDPSAGTTAEPGSTVTITVAAMPTSVSPEPSTSP